MAGLLNSGYPASLQNLWTNNRLAGQIRSIERHPRGGLRLASYNLHKCVGLDGRFDPERILQVIKELDADVIALQEVDRRFGDRRGLLDLARLEGETGLSVAPVAGLRRSHGWHGNLLLYRNVKLRNLEQLSLPGLEPRGAISGDFDLAGGGSLRVVGAHLGLLRASRRKQGAVLAEHMLSAADEAVLMGDLNEWRIDASAPWFAGASGGVDGAPASFPATRPVFPLDRILSRSGVGLSSVRVHRSDLSLLASDHLPVYCDYSGPLEGGPVFASRFQC